ncbi:hypothetical protein AB0G81_14520, partial [Streptomyces asoensis]|uniref:hypothetical protein n=1 Tax=Streptomyces asoensis TaxID=249586 RepID=UPI003403AA30
GIYDIVGKGDKRKLVFRSYYKIPGLRPYGASGLTARQTAWEAMYAPRFSTAIRYSRPAR